MAATDDDGRPVIIDAADLTNATLALHGVALCDAWGTTHTYAVDITAAFFAVRDVACAAERERCARLCEMLSAQCQPGVDTTAREQLLTQVAYQIRHGHVGVSDLREGDHGRD